MITLADTPSTFPVKLLEVDILEPRVTDDGYVGEL